MTTGAAWNSLNKQMIILYSFHSFHVFKELLIMKSIISQNCYFFILKLFILFVPALFFFVCFFLSAISVIFFLIKKNCIFNGENE